MDWLTGNPAMNRWAILDRPCGTAGLAGFVSGTGACGPARRAKDNSPAIHRWVCGRTKNKSRQGRKNARILLLATRFLSPLRGLIEFWNRLPTVETVGYSRSSLRDWPDSRLKHEPSSLFGQSRFQIELKPNAAVEAVTARVGSSDAIQNPRAEETNSEATVEC